MEKCATFAGAAAVAALTLLPTVASAQSVSIELVEARAMTAARPSAASQQDDAAAAGPAERRTSAQGQSATAPTHARAAERRSALREAARREVHSVAHQRNPLRDNTSMGKSDAVGSARCQSDIAEHRQQRRGAAQTGPANAGGNGKGANAR